MHRRRPAAPGDLECNPNWGCSATRSPAKRHVLLVRGLARRSPLARRGATLFGRSLQKPPEERRGPPKTARVELARFHPGKLLAGSASYAQVERHTGCLSCSPATVRCDPPCPCDRVAIEFFFSRARQPILQRKPDIRREKNPMIGLCIALLSARHVVRRNAIRTHREGPKPAKSPQRQAAQAAVF